jgi:hypothetical protein
MAQLPEGITEAEIVRYGRLDSALKPLQAEHKALGDKIKAAFNTIGSWVVANVAIKRSTANTFNSKGVEEKYPYAEFPEYYSVTPVLDKKKLPQEIIDTYTVKVERLSVSTVEIIEDGESK